MAGVARGGLIKPGRWTWSQERIAPEARALLRGARALVPFWEAGGRRAWDLVARQAWTEPAATSFGSWEAGARGIDAKFEGAHSGLWYDGGNSNLLAGATEFTIGWVWRNDDDTADHSIFHAGNNSNVRLQLFFDDVTSTGTNAPVCYLRSSTPDSRINGPADSALNDGLWHSWLVTWRAANETFRIYKDGVLVASDTEVDGVASVGDAGTTRIASRDAGSDPGKSGIAMMFVADRYFPEGDAVAFTRDPYQLLRPWRPVPPAGGSTTHALSGTVPLALALDGGIEVQRDLGGTLALALTLDAAIDVSGGFAGTLPLALTLGGGLGVRRGLDGPFALALTFGGPLDASRAFAGALPLVLQLNGTLATPAVLGDVAVSDAPRGGLTASAAPFGGIGLADTARGDLEVSDG